MRLLNLTALLDDGPTEKKSDKNRVLILNGVVRGDRISLESTLAAYLIELNNSPLFEKPEISKKSFELHRGIEVLKFTASLKIV